jgi:Tfp pilus assembly PilM family ATPase
MADLVVGIDIGERTIKAVQVSKSFKGGYLVTASEIVPIDENGNIQEALASLFQNEAFQDGRCALNLPSREVSFRQVRLPFTDRKKIDQTLTFELESKIPFSIEDIVADYLVTPHEGHGNILAAIADKSRVIERIGIVEAFHKKVEILDIDAFPVASCLLGRMGAGGSGLLLDVGEKDILGIFFSANRIIQARSFSKTENADRSEADWCIPLISQIRNTMAFLKWTGESPSDFSEIFLTGGGALDGNLQRHLSEISGVTVTPLDLAAETHVKIDDRLRGHWQGLVMNQALALAVRSKSISNAGFNFRLRIRKDNVRNPWLLKNIKWMSAAALAILLLALTEQYLDYALTGARVSRLKGEIRALIKQNAPEIIQIVDPLQQLNAKIMESRKMSQSLRGILSGTSLLDILRDISTLVPQSTPFAIQGITYDNNNIVLRGDTRNFDAVDAIKKELSRSNYLSSVVISSSQTTKQGDKVEFEMHMAVKNQL